MTKADRQLLRIVDETFAEAARRAGSHLACRPGCDECCHGPFPINALDARRLREGLAELAFGDPGRAAAVRRRAQSQLPRLREGFPGDPETGILAADDDAYFTLHGDLPCPALDPATGRCDLYSHRPLSCRTFGPPVRIGEVDLPPCRLCFAGASRETVEACRLEPDADGLEDRLLADLEEEDTLVAYALAITLQ